MTVLALNSESPWASARRKQGGLWQLARFYGANDLVSLLSRFGPVEVAFCVHVPPRLTWLPRPALGLVDSMVRRLLPRSGALAGARAG
jgi:hypothetical protein